MLYDILSCEILCSKRNSNFHFREGFLSSVAKSLQKKVAGGSLSPGNLSLSEAESLEESMKKVNFEKSPCFQINKHGLLG